MIDIHSHILFGVDDGASTIEQSLKLIGEAEKAGVKTIIATPHFQTDLKMVEKICNNFIELVNRADEYNVQLRLGYEVLINPYIPQIIGDKKSLMLDSSSYMLVELPFDHIPEYTYDVLYKLQLEGVQPIIAHPERNRSLVRDIRLLKGFIGRGCMLQLDAASIAGVYGWGVKQYTKKIIKLEMAQFVASDVHRAGHYTGRYQKAYQTVKKWAGTDAADQLFNANAKVITDNIDKKSYTTV